MIFKTIIALTSLASMLNPNFLAMNNDRANQKQTETVSLPADANVDTYLAKDNTMHNVVWLPDVKAPKMTSDPAKLNTPGYFHMESIVDEFKVHYEIYQTPFDENSGYFDLNKDLAHNQGESPLCFLVTASNTILYWFQQNKVYVDQYISNVRNGVYGQDPSLVKLANVDWDALTAKPTMDYINLFKGQALGKHYLPTVGLGAYYYRKDGYWPDRVEDFFFNGYNRYEKGDGDLENNEDNYKKDPFGGYFAPLLGNTKITKRYSGSNYKMFNDMILENLLKGNPMGLSYLNRTSSAGAHAISLWGAEYNEDNQLTRIFVTDGDDYDNNVPGTKLLRGLTAWDVYDKDGMTYISTNVNDPTDGGKLNAIYVLDLAQDLLKERLADLSKPSDPVINSQPISINNALNSYDPQVLTVGASTNDGGTLSYQWYKASEDGGVGTKLGEEFRKTLIPPTNVEGDVYYYCEVTNNKNGYLKTIKSNYAKVSTLSQDKLTDAQTPYNVYIPQESRTIKQPYGYIGKISVKASINDGGKLSYQWYYRNWGDNTAANGNPIKGATQSTFQPYNYPGRHFYYCVVTNTNEAVNGKKQASRASNYAVRIEVLDASGPFKDALDYAKQFLDGNVCGTNDNTKASSELFLKQAEAYKSLSAEAKTYFETSTGDKNSNNPILQVLAKYDRIISLYGKDETRFPDFMNRVGSQYFTPYLKQDDLINPNSLNNDSLIILLTSIGGLLIASFIAFIIKRKLTRK